MWWFVAAAGFLLAGGVWGTYASARTREERLRASVELVSLAALVAISVGLLRYYGNTEWASGVATGFLSVVVYDLTRKFPEFLRSGGAAGPASRPSPPT
ncbi:hypothetical protein [uncultured Cellulomonas sp.]|uniref:hypothetical protein n=1 Tax=uncultured Cellulomonas sp. TaxID=189682 RepID=UPI002624CA9D|nr:hypothetical protein [uncultured Cellulomonas sp.]